MDIGGKENLHAPITPLLHRMCMGVAPCATGRQD
jgi:hypothetical protein